MPPARMLPKPAPVRRPAGRAHARSEIAIDEPWPQRFFFQVKKADMT
jgi:hypothetical protein